MQKMMIASCIHHSNRIYQLYIAFNNVFSPLSYVWYKAAFYHTNVFPASITCAQLTDMGASMLSSLTTSQLSGIQDTDFTQCASLLGSPTDYSTDQKQALATVAKRATVSAASSECTCLANIYLNDVHTYIRQIIIFIKVGAFFSKIWVLFAKTNSSNVWSVMLDASLIYKCVQYLLNSLSWKAVYCFEFIWNVCSRHVIASIYLTGVRCP